MSNQKTKGEKNGVRSILTGFLVATLSFFALMLLAALVCYLGSDPTYKSELWSFSAMLLSGVIAGFINGRRQVGIITALLSALALILILFIIGSVAYGLPSMPTLVNYAIYVAISGIAAFFGTRRPKRRRHR